MCQAEWGLQELGSGGREAEAVPTQPIGPRATRKLFSLGEAPHLHVLQVQVKPRGRMDNVDFYLCPGMMQYKEG